MVRLVAVESSPEVAVPIEVTASTSTVAIVVPWQQRLSLTTLQSSLR